MHLKKLRFEILGGLCSGLLCFLAAAGVAGIGVAGTKRVSRGQEDTKGCAL